MPLFCLDRLLARQFDLLLYRQVYITLLLLLVRVSG
jgi:hypothetical protein